MHTGRFAGTHVAPPLHKQFPQSRAGGHVAARRFDPTRIEVTSEQPAARRARCTRPRIANALPSMPMRSTRRCAPLASTTDRARRLDRVGLDDRRARPRSGRVERNGLARSSDRVEGRRARTVLSWQRRKELPHTTIGVRATFLRARAVWSTAGRPARGGSHRHPLGVAFDDAAREHRLTQA